ncbi:disulfide bond formation protein DsbD [Vibrio cholerae]|nr:disulfide bond formation protein DsbD [Vibrio cholerae]
MQLLCLSLVVMRCQPLRRALCLLVFQWLKVSSIYVLCPFGSSFELLQQIGIVGPSS